MAVITIKSPNCVVQLDVEARADFIGCILGAVLAAAPCFLEAFMKCLGGSHDGGNYNPGDRQRCEEND